MKTIDTEDKPAPPRTGVGLMFLDSGAYGIYNAHADGRAKGAQGHELRKGSPAYEAKYAFFKSKEFFKYLDRYAAYIKEFGSSIDITVNVDAIYNPELSYQNLKELESRGVKPIPVIHCFTPMKWVERYLSEGYKFVGFGGLGHGTNFNEYARWADQAFDRICDSPGHLPLIKVHGFAMTSWRSIFRYPWWSVDSSSWVKMAAYGGVFFPRPKGKGWLANEMPRMVRFSYGCAIPADTDKLHFFDLSLMEQANVKRWLDFIGVPLGKFDENGKELELGVMTNWVQRARANLLFFEYMRSQLPDWPWPFKSRRREGFSL